MTFLVERLSELATHLDHLEELRPRISATAMLQFAARISNTRSPISIAEYGRANLTAAAQAPGASVDFLCELATDPTSARQLANELAYTTTRVHNLEGQRAHVAATEADHRPGEVPTGVARPSRPCRRRVPRHPRPRRVDGTDPRRQVLAPHEPRQPPPERRADLRRADRRRPRHHRPNVTVYIWRSSGRGTTSTAFPNAVPHVLVWL